MLTCNHVISIIHSPMPWPSVSVMSAVHAYTWCMSYYSGSCKSVHPVPSLHWIPEARALNSNQAIAMSGQEVIDLTLEPDTEEVEGIEVRKYGYNPSPLCCLAGDTQLRKYACLWLTKGC